MKRWGVVLLVDASVYYEVEAETAEEAMALAEDTANSPSICHQCSRELDIGDIIRALEAMEIKTGEDDPMYTAEGDDRINDEIV